MHASILKSVNKNQIPFIKLNHFSKAVFLKKKKSLEETKRARTLSQSSSSSSSSPKSLLGPSVSTEGLFVNGKKEAPSENEKTPIIYTKTCMPLDSFGSLSSLSDSSSSVSSSSVSSSSVSSSSVSRKDWPKRKKEEIEGLEAKINQLKQEKHEYFQKLKTLINNTQHQDVLLSKNTSVTPSLDSSSLKDMDVNEDFGFGSSLMDAGYNTDEDGSLKPNRKRNLSDVEQESIFSMTKMLKTSS